MIYLILAVVGAVVPMIFFVTWFNEFGYDIVAMTHAWKVNDATTGMMWDLAIVGVIMNVWMLAEVYVRKDYWVAPVCIVITWCVSMACGLALYLFLRSRNFK